MSVIDLSQLPAPSVVETIDFETLLAERKASLIALYPDDEKAAITATLALESEPITKLLQENAYREMVLRQRVNEAAKAVMLAYAEREDLDQIGANYKVSRLIINAGEILTPYHQLTQSMGQTTISVTGHNCHWKVIPPREALRLMYSTDSVQMVM